MAWGELISIINDIKAAKESGKLVDPYEQIPWVRSAVAAIYRNVYGTPLVAVSGTREADAEVKPLPDSDPLTMLIARPNPYQSGAEFGAGLVAYRKIDGIAYVALYGEGSTWWEVGKALPREMLTLNPRAVSVNERDAGTGAIKSYTVATSNAKQFVIPASAMLVFKDFNPRDLQMGSAPLASVWQAMEAYKQSDAYMAAMLENDGTPGLILKIKAGLGDKERKALRDSWDDRHKGARNARRTAVLPEAVDVQAPPPVMTAKDMEAVAMRGEVRDAIKAVLAVTDHEVGKVADYNRANAESARAWLWQNSIVPELMFIEEVLWSRVFEPSQRGTTGAKKWLRYDLSKVSALKPELAMSSSTAATLIATGTTDPQEVFDMLGLPLTATGLPELPAADGDTDAATSTEPVVADAKVAVAEAAGLNGAQVAAILQVLAAVSAGLLKPEAAVLTISSAFPSIPEATARRIVAGAMEAPTPEPAAAPAAKGAPHVWVKRPKDSQPVRPAVARRILEAWARHAERRLGVTWRKFTGARYAETVRLVRNLADTGPVSSSVVEGIMGNAAAWREGAKAAAKAGISGAGKPLLQNMELELGGFNRLDAGQEVYEVAAARRIGQMVEVGAGLRTRIRDSVTRAIVEQGTDGLMVADLEKVIEAKFGGRLPSNAATVARTEIRMFGSEVRHKVLEAEGYDERIWSAANDVHTRETHRSVDGERRPAGERFSNGLLYPLESGAPASEVVNCRCIELPYLKDYA